MDTEKRSISLATIELTQAVLALLIGLACCVILLWVASTSFGIDVGAVISFSERPIEATTALVIIFALLVPVIFAAYGLSLIAVRPLLQAADYEILVHKVLKSPGFGPLKRFLLGSSNADAT